MINLKQLEKNLNDSLAQETEESLNEWLDEIIEEENKFYGRTDTDDKLDYLLNEIKKKIENEL